MSEKPKRAEWPALTIPCPQDLERALLLYWDDILTPKKGEYRHPADVADNERFRAAIKVLLEFFE